MSAFALVTLFFFDSDLSLRFISGAMYNVVPTSDPGREVSQVRVRLSRPTTYPV